MLLSFVIVVYWCAVYTIVAVIVLGVVPNLRVTLLNLLAFVIGAFAGSAGILYVSGAFRLGFLDNYPMTLSLIGAVMGGTILVFLKTSLIKTSGNGRLL